MAHLEVCPHCGGPLPAPPPGQTHVHCHYCTRDIEVIKPEPKHHHRHSSGAPSSDATPKKGGSGCLVAFAIVGLVIAGAVAFEYVQKKSTPLHEHDFDWDAAGDPPAMALINPDGTEDFIGPYWVPTKGESRDTHTVWVGAFDGSTHTSLWRVGPFGSATRARGATHHAIAGDRVLVTDLDNIAHVYDLKTGSEKASVKIPDRARGACASPNGGPSVWIDVLGEQHVMIDTKTGTMTRSPARPAWCREQGTGACTSHRGQSRCLSANLPNVTNLVVDRVLADGDQMIAIGIDGTTKLPTIVGTDAAGTTKWRQTLSAKNVTPLKAASSVAEIGGGRFFGQYELTSGEWRLAAFDSKSGQFLWDVNVPGKKHGTEARTIVLSSSRAYLSHGDWLDVFDLKTGTNVGDFGK